MAKRSDGHLWQLMRVERAALAGDLAGLSDELWRAGTLCGEWSVEDVVAHLTAAGSMNQWAWLRSMLGARFNMHVHNQRRIEEHRGATPAETLERFRTIVGSRTAPSSDTVAYLGEVVVHAEDIRRPLGLTRVPDVAALTPVAEFFAARDFAVNSRSLVAGLRLEASDGPFGAGEGPSVTGTTLALVMAMAGRAAFFDELDGPGVDELRARVAKSNS
ncbi:maleylpyruvate isomerase family mycothiol-dependent enzyme [Salinibacterium sp. dk2585]|uniref:maleylpyruvate isomerase family mycothiol-dependent enzyme n=1 Tax=unclassified Salinibacterium TaxID=2632331 RepID=UPI0011C24F7B|nr:MULTISPECIES: maleylpyruvate isomerase family mycothiol-dependent enzyme [unclassified Salinibacterium]QEE62045.1 maleylpyruvate isomerase family mycothiol-dependent enzyme [Salinibacterium sp. dk2585]TXK52209.1 maleylpyruvate isomerase family mycothiol-dependent enzyme [Salinibacterium sp. dk5596]